MAVFSLFFAYAAPTEAAEAADVAFRRLYFGLQPPTNRDFERSVELIEDLLDSGRYSEAAPLIDAQLRAPSDRVDSRGGSLKRRLRRALDRIDPRGRAALRAVLDGAFQARLIEATTPAELRRLVASHPPRLFGTEGLTRLAEAEAAVGDYQSAALAFEAAAKTATVLGRESDAATHAVLGAVNRLRRGDPVADSDALGVAEERFEALRLAAVAEAERNTERRSPQAWLVAGSDARRNAVVPGRPPEAWRSWRVALETPAADDAFACGTTVAAAGTLVTETPRGLIAVSAGSGKRLWQVRRRTEAWGEPVGFGLATDTRLVFMAVESSTPHTPRENRYGRQLFDNQRSGPPARGLAAYEIASGGRLRWRLDGADPGSPITGATFLGPPAPTGSRLYALVEVQQSICLVQIEADSGSIAWVQPIMRRQRALGHEQTRIPLTPTVGSDLIYCPTGRGAVVAVDPLRREIAWLHYLPVDRSDASPPRQNGWRGLRSRGWVQDVKAWRHARLIEQAGRLVIVSPAVPALEVVDAANGESAWSRKAPEGLLLTGVDDEAALLVESKRVTARSLEDGRRLWSARLPEGDGPAGEGLRLERSYVLPLRSGRFAVIATDSETSGQRVALLDPRKNRLDAPVVLGDLLYHRGAVYSRSAGSLERFDQTKPDGTAPPSENLARWLADHDAAPDDKELSERLALAILEASKKNPMPTAAGPSLDRLVAGPRAAAHAAVLEAEESPGEGMATLTDLVVGPGASVVFEPERGWRVDATRLVGDRVRRAFGDDDRVFGDALSAEIERLPREADRLCASRRLSDLLAAPAEPRSRPGRVVVPASRRWSLNRVRALVDTVASDAKASRSSRRPKANRPRPVRAATTPRDLDEPHRWWLEPRAGSSLLVGVNGWGERAFAAATSLDASDGSRDGAGGVGLPGDRAWRGWLALRVEGGFAVYSVDHPGTAVWTSEQSPSGAWRDAGAGSGSAESPVAIGPWGVVSLGGATLTARDLISGDVRWRREINPIGGGPFRVLATPHDLLVCGRDEDGVRYSAHSGERIDAPWGLPAPKRWLAQAAGRLLVEARSRSKRELQLLDIDTASPDSDPLWRVDAPSGAQIATGPDGLAAVLTEDHELTVVDLATARERFTTRLEGVSDGAIVAVRLHPRADGLLVEVDHSNAGIDRVQRVAPLGERPLLTGELYSLDASTGASRWAGPARIHAMSLAPQSVRGCPLILMGRRLRDEPSDAGAATRIALVALDPLTGGTVYSNHDLAAGPIGAGIDGVEASYESGRVERLAIRLGASRVTLEPTDGAASPRPPMVAAVEDPHAAGPPDPSELRRRLFRTLIGAE